MIQTKLKLTDLRTGQEYLLLATRMNLKGLLIETSKTLPVGTPVKATMSLEDGGSPATVKGDIHRIADKQGGGKAMIVRFVEVNQVLAGRIEKLIERSHQKPGEPPRSLTTQERTMMINLDTLEKASLAAPDSRKRPLSHTQDEEAYHDAKEGLSGATRVGIPDDYAKYTPKKRTKTNVKKWFLGGTFVSILAIGWILRAPILSYLEARFGKRPQRDTPPIVSTAEPSPTTVQSTPIPKVARAISDYEIVEEEDAVRITFSGDGRISAPKISQASSPNRLILEFAGLSFSNLPEMASVSKNPVFRIRFLSKSEIPQVVLDLYPVDFPTFTTEVKNEKLHLFLNR